MHSYICWKLQWASSIFLSTKLSIESKRTRNRKSFYASLRGFQYVTSHQLRYCSNDRCVCWTLVLKDGAILRRIDRFNAILQIRRKIRFSFYSSTILNKGRRNASKNESCLSFHRLYPYRYYSHNYLFCLKPNDDTFCILSHYLKKDTIN